MASGWPTSVTGQNGGRCGFSAQGEYVCAPSSDTPGSSVNVEKYTQVNPGSSFLSCPTSPYERPNCTTECSLLIRDDSCAHLEHNDSPELRKCKLCQLGCCRETGVPSHGLVSMLLQKNRGSPTN